MIVEIKKGSSPEEIQKAIIKLRKHRKLFSAKKHFGKAKLDIDGLNYQKKMRNEWD